MSTLHRRLRQQMPYLTPGFFPDDDDELAVRLPRLQPPSDEADIDKIWRLGGPPTAPTLAREQVPPMNRPTLVPPLETSAMLPPPVADNFTVGPPRVTDAQLAEAGAPPMILRRDGRPTTKFIGEGTQEERLGVRRRALEEYEPQKESKKMLALRTILNFVGGGIPGAAQTLIGPGGVLDRRGVDRAWQQQQLGRVDEQYGRLRTDRRAGLQDRLLESQIAENNAQANKTPQRPPPLLRGRIVAKDEFPGVEAGTEIRQEFDSATGQMKDAMVNGKPVVTRAPRPRTSGTPHISTRIVAAGEFEGIPEGTEIRTIWNGQEYEDQVRGGKPIIATTTKPSEDPSNERINENIAELESQIEKLGSPPPTEIDDVRLDLGKPVVVGKKVNPAYIKWAEQYDAKSKEIRDLKLKRKTPPTLTRTPTGFNRKGQSMSRASLPEAAKRMEVSVEEAEAQLKREGVTFH